MPDPLDGQSVAAAVEVSVEAPLHPVALQQGQDLGAGIALVERRVVEEAQLGLLPRRLQRRLQPDELPVEDLLVVALLCLLYTSPSPRDA